MYRTVPHRRVTCITTMGGGAAPAATRRFIIIIIQGRILPRNRCALMCIDKHDDDVQAQASAREDQPGSGADGEYEATDDRYLP